MWVGRCASRWWSGWSALVLSVSLVLTALPQRAGAQDPSDAAGEGEYASVISGAVREFDAGNWREARALFLRAHEHKPSARTLRGLGFVEFELRNYARADHLLRQALSDTRNPLTDDQRQGVAEVLARAQNFLGRFRIESTPGTARVLVDGTAASPAADGSIVLEAGEHELTVSAPSHRTHEQRLDVGGGENQTIRVELLPIDPGPAVAAGSSAGRGGAPADGGEGTTQRIIGWTTAGAGVLLAGAGLVFALQRSSQLSKADAICPSGDCGPISMTELTANNARIRQLTEDADTSGTIGLIGLAVGGALAATGLILVLTAPSSTGEVDVAPAVSPAFGGITVTAKVL